MTYMDKNFQNHEKERGNTFYIFNIYTYLFIFLKEASHEISHYQQENVEDRFLKKRILGSFSTLST